MRLAIRFAISIDKMLQQALVDNEILRVNSKGSAHKLLLDN
jgi:hypothetical protein